MSLVLNIYDFLVQSTAKLRILFGDAMKWTGITEMLTVIVRNKYDAYRMHSGWPFSQHTPFPDRWGFEPSIDYQLLPG